MSAELHPTGCRFRSLVCKNGAIAILVVLLAVAATGWIVTATRKSPAEVETVEILVAAKDIPVGTVFVRDDLIDDKVVKTKRVSKAELPSDFVTERLKLVDRRLFRPIRADEPFNPLNLGRSNGTGAPLPRWFGGVDTEWVQVRVDPSAGGYFIPESRVNVFATMRLGKELRTFPLLVNVIGVELTVETVEDPKGRSLPTVGMASLFITYKQSELLSLARSRGCTFEVVRRDPDKTDEAEKDYDIDRATKFLSEMPEAPVEVEPRRPLGKFP